MSKTSANNPSDNNRLNNPSDNNRPDNNRPNDSNRASEPNRGSNWSSTPNKPNDPPTNPDRDPNRPSDQRPIDPSRPNDPDRPTNPDRQNTDRAHAAPYAKTNRDLDNPKSNADDATRLKELDDKLANSAMNDPARAGWNKDRGDILTRQNAPPEAANAKVEKIKVDLFDAVSVEDTFAYPFLDMKPGQGFFVPNEPNQTTTQNARRLHRSVNEVNNLYTEIETNENGDEVWEDVYVKTSKWENDKLIVDAGGHPTLGHDIMSRPNIIYSRRYAVRQIAKDDWIGGKQSESDGVLVVRVI